MKNLIILILLLISIQVDAQKISFVDTTNEWYVFYTTGVTPSGFIVTTHTVTHYYYSGRKTINGKDYLTVSAESNNLRYTTKYNYNTRTYDTQSIDKYKSSSIACYVRKDSLSGNIYITYTDTGTTEYLRYNNNAIVGDTIRPYPVYSDAYFVAAKDSMLINNTYHQVLTMQPTRYSNYSTYRSVEGLGSLTEPFGLSIISSSYHVGNTAKLICFKNRYGYLQTNGLPDINCLDTNLNVLDTLNNPSAEVRLSPQPATTFVNIQLPGAVTNATIFIYNRLGQAIFSETIQNSSVIKLNAPATPGLYYYRITDNATGRIWQGKVLFE